MNIIFRKATREDVPEIVRLLADDPLGSKRELYTEPLPSSYYSAFEKLNTDENYLLMVAELDNKIIGTMQLIFMQFLAFQGGKRALVEAVRIDKSLRGKGFGKKMFEWAIEKAKENNCHVIQLTTDKKRPDAFKFYEKLSFEASHEGMKLHL